MRNKIKDRLKYYFDEEADVLYFAQRKPSPKDISQEIGEGIIVRIDSISKKIVGFTILNFLKRKRINRRSITLPLRAKFELVK